MNQATRKMLINALKNGFKVEHRPNKDFLLAQKQRAIDPETLNGFPPNTILKPDTGYSRA